MSRGIIRVGISGWTHASWRGPFYPKGLRREQELGYAASCFRTLEVNSTFYGPMRPEAFRDWGEQVPVEFVFAVRGPRLITHVLRLRDVQPALARFLASGVLRLGLHLGPILWQLPANLPFDSALIERFLRLLPRSADAAATLAARYDSRLSPAPRPGADPPRPLRHAIEVRHASFRCPAFVELLRAHEVALVCSDAPTWPRMMDLTADFAYCRLQGPKEPQVSSYDSAALDTWVARCRAWANGAEPEDGERVAGKGRARKRDVFIIFDNHSRIRAPASATELIRRLRM